MHRLRPKPGHALLPAARHRAAATAACPALVIAWLGATGLLAGCNAPPPPGWTGYAEGDHVRVAAPLGGALVALALKRYRQTVE